ncbi:enoyl-CoA hydratase/isomerase family protein [Bordetella sp. BOR01]|uniref:enoyl-CoA hydratase/isomerase family protein n=1 Tax=Bordetella sp. BOR01 TaxID=2854779 RepID=UPI001C4950A6|nr:enoyl-CoA hydratase/isomerase family protein [Bordetella sp. BOR01]MBV7481689.1 enoyl-CoA hydratase/isomerase family protein [Bordetella sp. BOR01]
MSENQVGKAFAEAGKHGTTTIYIDNPGHRNALNNQLIDQLTELFGECARNPDCRVIVLRGSGGIFCAGRELRDLLALQSAPISVAEETYQRLRRLNEAVYFCTKPTVAVIEGYAFGAGATVASWCDLVIGEKDAFICYPEAHRGVPPSPAVMALIRGIGRKHAMDLLLTGRRVPMQEAVEIGIATRAVSREQLEDELERLTASLLRGSPEAQRRTKEFIWQCEDAGLRAGIDSAVQNISFGLLSTDAREGVTAFLESRAPAWSPV